VCRRSVLLFFLVLASLGLASTASADYDCMNVCDPISSPCDQYCEICMEFSYEGCIWWVGSSCGDSSSGCIPTNCTPSWYESNRVNQGTYDGRSLNHCNHHVVDKVTLTDSNHCNTNSSYWSYWYCDDYIDDYKNGCCYPSCCEGTGELNTQLECDGGHSCS
jgi:hypothetical protein